MLDSFKERKDVALREEVKDRLQEGLRESHQRIMKLEQNVATLGYKVCESDEVEEIVKKRFD